MHQVTTKEGTQQAYLIASQVDNQLFGSESQGLSDPIHVLERISDNLTKHARNVLAKTSPRISVNESGCGQVEQKQRYLFFKRGVFTAAAF